jgi:hypothetical protein
MQSVCQNEQPKLNGMTTLLIMAMDFVKALEIARQSRSPPTVAEQLTSQL